MLDRDQRADRADWIIAMGKVLLINSKFNDFKDHSQNSRTFQGSFTIFVEIQGLFKDVRHQSEIQGF